MNCVYNAGSGVMEGPRVDIGEENNMISAGLLAEAKETVRDLSVRELIEEAVRNGEGTFSDRGALRVTTGTHTGRSPKDKFIVDTPLTHDVVNWDNNQP